MKYQPFLFSAKYRRPRRENAEESYDEESEGDDESSNDTSGSEKKKGQDEPDDHSELRQVSIE